MTTRPPFTALFGGADRGALDLPVAALAGLAVAFAIFTVPDDLLADAVAATGIANLVAAAQPPLGTTARIVLALTGSVAAFAGAFVLLRWLDRFALRAPAPAGVEPEAPRIRKSDAHPDAPPRRPISASRDLGEPAPPARPAPRPAPDPAIASSSVPAVPAATQSLGDLMARLERGLARREQAPPPVAAGNPADAPPPSSDRLQNAIEGLRALSVRA